MPPGPAPKNPRCHQRQTSSPPVTIHNQVAFDYAPHMAEIYLKKSQDDIGSDIHALKLLSLVEH